MTIQEAIERYLKQIKRSKSPRTAISYRRGLNTFALCMAQSDEAIDFNKAGINTLSPLWIETFLNRLQKQSVSTEHLYTTDVAGFYRYVAAQEWASINLSTLDFEMSQRRSQGKRLHVFPEGDVEKVLDYIQKEVAYPQKKQTGTITI